MTRMNKWILGGVIALILLVAGLIWYAASATAPEGSLPATALSAHSPYQESGPYYALAANFPTTTPLSGGANAAALSSMRGWVVSEIAQFKKDANVVRLTPAQAQKQGLTNGRKYTLDIVYLEGSSAHTVSYIYTVYENTGGAHGNTFFKTFTFNTHSGTLLTLSDIFTGNYLEKLSALAGQTLAQNLGQFATASAIKDGTAPEAKNFSNWFFDNADFVLLFPPYQVAAYAAGPQTVRIPAAGLQGYLRKSYP